jgi:hypothetical protein
VIARKMRKKTTPSAGRLGPFWEAMPPGDAARRDNPRRRRPFPDPAGFHFTTRNPRSSLSMARVISGLSNALMSLVTVSSGSRVRPGSRCSAIIRRASFKAKTIASWSVNIGSSLNQSYHPAPLHSIKGMHHVVPVEYGQEPLHHSGRVALPGLNVFPQNSPSVLNGTN